MASAKAVKIVKTSNVFLFPSGARVEPQTTTQYAGPSTPTYKVIFKLPNDIAMVTYSDAKDSIGILEYVDSLLKNHVDGQYLKSANVQIEHLR